MPKPLTNWYISRIISRSRRRYTASLAGQLDGKGIETSPITAINGRTITTRSGSTYILTGPDFWGRNVEPDEFPYPFYLDNDNNETYPPGSTVPALQGEP